MTIELRLDKTIRASEGKLTRSNIAEMSGVRPNTIGDLCNGKTKAIKLDALDHILDAMNRIDSSKNYDINDIIVYTRN